MRKTHLVAVIVLAFFATARAQSARFPVDNYGAKGDGKTIDDPDYQKNVFHYILNQEDAWTWSYKDPFPEDEEEDPKPRDERSESRG